MPEEQENLTEQEYFDKYVNISYVDSNLPIPDNKVILKHYLCSAFLYGFVLLFIWANPYFYGEFGAAIDGFTVRKFLIYLYAAYLIIAPCIFFTFRPKTLWISHNTVVINYLIRILKHRPKFAAFTLDNIKEQLALYKMSYKESQSLVLLFIKMFYGPIMLSGVFINFDIMKDQLPDFFNMIQTTITNVQNNTTPLYMGLMDFRSWFYSLAVTILFFLDVAVYAFGYLTESVLFNNRIRSVDNTPDGLFFCLICYGPFSYAPEQFFGFFQGDYNVVAFGDINHWVTWLFYAFNLIFLFIYTAASIALFTKASNLTNRGTVSRWPYSMVRHPAYSAKLLFWWSTVIPLFLVNFYAAGFNPTGYILMVISTVFSMCVWTTIYYFRALTEERHLMKDPQYREYVKNVKYRFIPGLW